jgi:sorbitol-specific phosphotransferase system component IIBC
MALPSTITALIDKPACATVVATTVATMPTTAKSLAMVATICSFRHGGFTPFPSLLESTY